MRSPFKFLDPFELADKDVFFGRDKEVDTLYRMVYQSNLILVYGYSGTGKTSLIQCGLAGRFDGPQWHPFFIRKGEDINASTRAALAGALGEDIPEGAGLAELVEAVLDEYLSPVYLIFDQFEELFILGSYQEQEQFARDIRELLGQDLSCKVAFIIREEYLGELYQLEQALPRLFNFKLRVEPMNKLKVQEVLQSSFAAFNISLEAPAEQRLEEIIENVSLKKAGIQLPYLQVYLDMLWREDYERTYPKWEVGSGKSEGITVPDSGPSSSLSQVNFPLPPSHFRLPPSDFPPLEFTQEEIKDFGTIEEVLPRFLEEQEGAIRKKLREKYPEAAVERETIQKVLDAFVTEEGTKRPVPFEWKPVPASSSAEAERRGAGPRGLEELIIPPRMLEKFPLGNPILTTCLQALEQSRILRVREGAYELAHDSLAALIDGRRTNEQRQLNEEKVRLAGIYREWQRSGQFLSRKQLTLLEPFRDKLALEPHLQQFVQDSYAYNEAQEEARRQREREELEKERRLRGEAEKAQQEAEKRRRTRIAAALALLSVLALVFALQQCEKASSTNQALESTVNTLQTTNEKLAEEQQKSETRRIEAENLSDSLKAQGRELANNLEELQKKETALQQSLREAKAAKDTAEVRRIEAELSESKAKQQTLIAEAAKADLETYAREAMPVLLADIKNLILTLQYDHALARCETAWNLNKEPLELTLYFQEIAFFFTESGAFNKAEEALAYIGRKPARSSSQPAQHRKELLAAVERIDAKYLKDTLEKRYYPEMVNIKGGAFCMQRDPKETGSCDTSRYAEATLDDFRLGKTEVTVWQYNLYCAGSGQDSLERIQAGLPWELQGSYPVVRVNWYDAARYANWINRQMGQDTVYDFVRQIDEDNWEISLNDKVKDAYRLPTEAEWEYAARGGLKQDTFLYSGDSDLNSVAWYYYNSNGRTHAVAQKKPNSLKLYDMSGNVWEWCWDWYGELEPGVFSNPRGPVSGSGRSLRGGSWYVSNDRSYEVAFRLGNDPNVRSSFYGFRLSQD